MKGKTLRNLLLLAVGAAGGTLAVMNRDKLEKTLHETMKHVDTSKEEAKKIVDDVLEKSKEARSDLQKQIEERSQAVMDRMKVATKDELEELKKKIDQLEKKL